MEFIGDIVRKTREPSILAVEAAKASRAFEIGKDSGLFYVPKVASFDTEAGVLEFERLDGLVTLIELAAHKNPRLLGLLEIAGKALAVVHEELILPEEMKYELQPEWMDSPDENVFVHGDFTLRNVCFEKTSGQLVITDWSTAPFLGRKPVCGSRLFDIIWFINYIFYGVPRSCIFRWDAAGMSNAFLSGYSERKSDIIGRLDEDCAALMHRYYRRTIWHQAKQRPCYKAIRYLLYQSLIYPRYACYHPGHG